MEGIEKPWWAKHQLEEQIEGRQRLITRTGEHLSMKMDDSCLTACYFAMIRSQKTGQYRTDIKGYLRTFSGYCNGARLEQLSEEISGPSVPVRELEAAWLSVSKEELWEFIRELGQQDETVEGAEKKV